MSSSGASIEVVRRCRHAAASLLRAGASRLGYRGELISSAVSSMSSGVVWTCGEMRRPDGRWSTSTPACRSSSTSSSVAGDHAGAASMRSVVGADDAIAEAFDEQVAELPGSRIGSSRHRSRRSSRSMCERRRTAARSGCRPRTGVRRGHRGSRGCRTRTGRHVRTIRRRSADNVRSSRVTPRATRRPGRRSAISHRIR